MVMEDDLGPLFSHNSEKTDTEKKEPDSEAVVEKETESEVTTEVLAETETEIETEVVAAGETYHLVIPAGSVPRLICNELEENGVIESASELRQYLSDMGFAKSIVVGEYDIPYGSTNEEIYQILKAGPL